jgi:hypothetical protein
MDHDDGVTQRLAGAAGTVCGAPVPADLVDRVRMRQFLGPWDGELQSLGGDAGRAGGQGPA